VDEDAVALGAGVVVAEVDHEEAEVTVAVNGRRAAHNSPEAHSARPFGLNFALSFAGVERREYMAMHWRITRSSIDQSALLWCAVYIGARHTSELIQVKIVTLIALEVEAMAYNA
jgi:hypothetical protein